MNSQQFKETVLQQFFTDIHRIERDNYSARRFSYDGVDRSEIFDVAKHIAMMEWFTSHADDVFTALTFFADQPSRDIYFDILRFKLAGHLHVRIRSGLLERAFEEAQYRQTFTATPSALQADGMFGHLVHYDAEWKGERYTIDTLVDGLLINLVYRQYFFDRGGVTIGPSPGDHVIDGGACTGDTAAVFRGAVGSTGRVYAFDPVQSHYDICKYNFARPSYENVSVQPYGISDKNVDAPMAQLTNYNPGYHPMPNDAPIPMRRIDDLVLDGTIERVDFVKFDIEGGEMAALNGMLSTIHHFRPKLAISIYHKPNDFFEIIKFLHDLRLGYRLYLDHYTIYDEETVVYAIAD